MQTINRNGVWMMRAAAVVAVAFGMATIFSGANVLFADGAAAAGNSIPFVVWFNFLAGFVYVATGAGLWLLCRWSYQASAGLAIANLLVFAALALAIFGGTAYEMRTVAAMTLRTVLWLGIAVLAWWVFLPVTEKPGSQTVPER